MDEIKEDISNLLASFSTITKEDALELVGGTAGKRYEAWVLARVIQHLVEHEDVRVTFVGGENGQLKLKGAPGPINASYAHFDIYKENNKGPSATLWTDVEFAGISYSNGGTFGEYHELDILMCTYGTTERPSYKTIWLGVECKHRLTSPKSMLREMLGVRRELSFHKGNERFPTKFGTILNQSPASCLIFCSIDDRPSNHWQVPGKNFGIQFIHEPIE